MDKPTTILYLTKRFPRLSETFILEEIIGLEQNGIDLKLFSIGDPKESVIQNKVKKVKSPLWYLHNNPSSFFLDSLFRETQALVCIGIKSPKRLFKALKTMVSKKFSLKSLKHLLEGAVIAKEAKKLNVDGLHAAFAHSPAAIISYASDLSGIGFSFAGHAKDIFTTDKTSLANRAYAAQFVLCCSRGAFDEMVKIAPGANVVYMPHGVDIEEFRPFEDKFFIHNKLHLLCVGRLVEKKGISFLLHAADMLKRRGIDFQLRICGGGELKPHLSKLALELDLKDEVEFLGEINHEEVIKQLAWCDIYIQPSIQLENGDKDGVPNALLEAMACAKAVVASSIAGIPEVITNGINGILVRPKDPIGLFAALKTLAQNMELRNQLGKNAVVQIRNNWNRKQAHKELKELFVHTYSPGKIPNYFTEYDLEEIEQYKSNSLGIKGFDLK